MLAGPIVARDLKAASRQPRTYRRRSALATLMAVILGGGYAASYSWDRGWLSVQQMAVVAHAASGLVVFYQYNLTVWLVPIYVAAGIAGERERRTLGDLLLTRLSSAEIVLGKLAAGLVEFATSLALGLPTMGVLLLAGVDTDIVLLAFAGILSMAFFIGALSILVSTGCRRSGNAMRLALSLTGAWLIFPFVVEMFLRRAVPQVVPWVYRPNLWLLTSSPLGVLVSAIGTAFAWSTRVAFLWMIGLQIAAGTLMIGWAISRLRSVSRKLEDGATDGLPKLRGRHRWRLFSRPECGESPMLWKEMHTGRTGGFAQFSEILVIAAIFGLIGYGAYQFGKPAAVELFARLTRKAATDASRLNFNMYLRSITSLVELVCLIIIGGAAAEAIAAERARATWDSLLATLLGSREILRAKMVGAMWKVRGGILLLLALWSDGIMTGSLHPVGVVAAMLLLATSAWFMAALGTYSSLVSRDARAATARTTIPLILLTHTFLYLFSNRSTSVMVSAGSVPFVNWLCLVSYRDVAEAIGQGSLSYLSTMAILTNEGAGRVLGTYLLTVIGYAAGAAWFTKVGFIRFDRLVGRPKPGSAPAACDSTRPATTDLARKQRTPAGPRRA